MFFSPSLNRPRTAHGLVDETIGLRIVDEKLLLRIELELATKPEGNFAEIDQSTGAVAVAFVEREGRSGSYSFCEVTELWRRVGELSELGVEVRNIRFQTTEQFSVWTFDERSACIDAFTIENDAS